MSLITKSAMFDSRMKRHVCGVLASGTFIFVTMFGGFFPPIQFITWAWSLAAALTILIGSVLEPYMVFRINDGTTHRIDHEIAGFVHYATGCIMSFAVYTVTLTGIIKEWWRLPHLLP